MKSARIVLSLCVTALLFTLLSPNVRADEWNKKTTFTFSGPVEVAGHRLEAGTYVFKLADTIDRHVVQISNADETHVYATILAIPDMRLTPTDKTVVKFSENSNERASNDVSLPQDGLPIKEWFYPGDTYGQEFRVKPAPLVADASGTPVLSSASASEPPAADSNSVTPAPEEKAEESAAPAVAAHEAEPPAPAAAAAPTDQDDASAAQTPAKKPVDSDDAAESSSKLPQTASSLPLIGLIGLITTGVGVSLREYLKRTA